MQQAHYCEWLWHSATVLCDGTVTCGLDDPYASRSYGNVRSATLAEIYAGQGIRERRQKLLSGSPCETCGLYSEVGPDNHGRLAPTTPLPKTLVLEPSIRCNIRCNNATCNIANDPAFHLRREDFMAWPIFTKLMDEVGTTLDILFFYNYGEPFAHPRALEMLAYVRALNPRVSIVTSTNGILLARAGLADRIVEERLVDSICFTIGGCDEETYLGYHKGGSFTKAMEGMRRVVEAKRASGRDKPAVHWRYLVFNWNDADEHINEALRLKDEIGVDKFSFMLTASPMEGRSLRRAPGTPGFEAIAPWVDYQEFYAVDPMAEAGLWGREAAPEWGPFSWTGIKARVQVTPRDGSLTVRLLWPENPMSPCPQVTLRTPWGEMAAQVGTGRWGVTELPVPAAPSGNQPVPVELVLSSTFNPTRALGGEDSRDLGVMLSLEGVSVPPNPFRTAQLTA